MAIGPVEYIILTSVVVGTATRTRNRVERRGR